MSRHMKYVEYEVMQTAGYEEKDIAIGAFVFNNTFRDNLDTNKYKSVEIDKTFPRLHLQPQVAILTGSWKGVKVPLWDNNTIFEDFVFTDCHFLSDTRIDTSIFINCTFINCVIEGALSDVDFMSCNFSNCKLPLSWVHECNFDKKCTFNNVQINIASINDFIRIGRKHYYNEFLA